MTLQSSRSQRAALDKIVVSACAVFAVLTGWAALGPGGMGLPIVAQALLTASLLALLLGHMWKHLGSALMAAFFLTGSAVEWVFEQTNISFGGFIWGDIRYGDIGVFNVHLGDVPLAVPVLMAALLWPTYATVNLALNGRVVVDPRSVTWWQNLWRCGLYGLVHSWLMLIFNGDCEKFGLYRWVGRSLKNSSADMFLGDPAAPRGWAIYVFVTMVAFTFVMVPSVGKAAVRRGGTQVLRWSDGAPIVLFGAMALMVYVNPTNKTVGNVALWTMGFFALFVAYRFVDLMRGRRTATIPSTTTTSV
ncbi:hypothetical protein [Mycobacterium sp. 94-17]|uniref:hypothetical protein n=1 Tax=Mycobacterium sp. 94-17 TaxID=2986147 RepID=UPI002D1E6A49|nr:hypothetical protein [Mycobacterium sp. 94-17]MEB4209534.1 hypothetical protein [Mycobacterium sp. 94-17]